MDTPLSCLELRPNFKITSGGYAGEETGIIGQNSEWRSAGDHGELFYEYYFRDSDYSDNNKSSRVVAKLKTQYQAFGRESGKIEVQCFINLYELRRDDIRGNPGNVRRNILLSGRTSYKNTLKITDSAINANYTMWTGELNLASGMEYILPSFTGTQQFGIDVRSNVTGHDGTPIPSPFVDQMWFGVEFRNTFSLPKAYRPGKIFKQADNKWYSHNRTGGKANLTIDNIATLGMVDDPEQDDNIPSIYNTMWNYMKKIGERQDD